MRFLLTLGLLFCTLLTTGQSPPNPDTQHLMALLNQERVLHFRLVEMYDPYEGGSRLQPRSSRKVYLSLGANHRFVLRQQAQKQVGEWRMANHQLSFLLPKSGQATRGTSDVPPTRMEFISFRKGKLTLRRQGRHGYVSYVYRLMERD